MNLFTLLAAFGFLGIAFATLVACLWVLWGVRKRKLRATLLRIGLCLVPLVLFTGFCIWLFGPADFHSPGDLAAAYRTEFGSDPPPDVTDLNARQIVVGDSGGAWLRFRASGTTIDSLLGKFSATDRSHFAEAGTGANVPDWWTPEQDGIEFFYIAENWSDSWSDSVAVLGIDRSKSMVYFHHSGID
ncbi:hypothetical protein [Luteolibacter marinus]|uniref:hypothetical protein n=1 Tax=Luteolibacter marinus TaxID=2776705 RepID=UPI001868140E|nr:hypothetical protein [Luteolibacter marinus]